MVFGVATAVTDDDGEFTANVYTEQDASLSSGLKAIRFKRINGEERETLSGTGKQIADFAAARGGRLEIDAQRLVRPEPLCKTFSLSDGSEALRFPYTNRQSDVLKVESEGLNTLSSITGQPYPASEFTFTDGTLPDGYYGFEWPLHHFTWLNQSEERVAASWQLLGQLVSVDQPSAEVPLCTSLGQFQGCSRVTDEGSEQIFQQAMFTVRSLNQALAEGIQRGKLKATGKLRVASLKHFAETLREIRMTLRQLPAVRFFCSGEIHPNCVQAEYPKKQLLLSFDNLMKIKFAASFKQPRRTHRSQRKQFKALVEKQPSSYVTCRSGGG